MRATTGASFTPSLQNARSAPSACPPLNGHPQLGRLDKLYQLSALGLGQQLQLQEEPGYAVTIYDRVANGASAKVDSLAHVNVDYLHIAKWNGEWLVVNVLWALRPEVRPA
jgi:hypothetical protein